MPNRKIIDLEALGYNNQRLTSLLQIQKETMPTASAALVGKVYQYIGTTSGSYTHNYFYECSADTSTTPPTYSWVQTNVQAGGSGDDDVWIGTRAEYEAAKTAGTIPDDIMVAITDEPGSGGGVSSVNGKTGEVTLTASDVSALPASTSIPSKTSDLTNDSDFVADANYVHTDNNYTTAEKTKLSGIETGAAVNVQSDWNQTDTSADDYIKNKPTFGTAAVKDSTGSVIANSTDLVESGAVKTAIDNAVAGAYHHAGTKTVAELISSLLVVANEGNVYNITDSGTTTADFIEGAGLPIHVGDNVGIAKVSENTYKFDLLSGLIDASNFVTKSDTSGLLKNDGTVDTNEYALTSDIPVITGKADKVDGAVSGNFAGLDSNGNLTDSGKKATDFATPADVANENISATVTNTSFYLTDSADGYLQGVTVKGHSEDVEGVIKSIGDAGWGVVDLGTLEWTGPAPYTYVNRFSSQEIANMAGSPDPTIASRFVSRYRNRPVNDPSGEYWMPGDIVQYPGSPRIDLLVPKDITTVEQLMQYIGDNNYVYYPLADTTGATPIFGITSKNGAGQGTAATITTGLPLRSTLDGTVYDELTNEKVITRCEVVSDEVVPLATPTETPLTSAEKSALASLRTYDHTTHIDATDEPTMTVDYLLNTNNGQAVSKVDERSVSQISNLLSLIAAPYNDTATYAQGAYCTYLGTLYKATTAIGTAEPFNPSHWTATTIMAEM